MPKLPKINLLCYKKFINSEDTFLFDMKGEVYNISSILKTHVGGIELFNRCINEPEKHYYFHSSKSKKKWKSLKVGILFRLEECKGCLACKSNNN